MPLEVTDIELTELTALLESIDLSPSETAGYVFLYESLPSAEARRDLTTSLATIRDERHELRAALSALGTLELSDTMPMDAPRDVRTAHLGYGEAHDIVSQLRSKFLNTARESRAVSRRVRLALSDDARAGAEFRAAEERRLWLRREQSAEIARTAPSRVNRAFAANAVAQAEFFLEALRDIDEARSTVNTAIVEILRYNARQLRRHRLRFAVERAEIVAIRAALVIVVTVVIGVLLFNFLAGLVPDRFSSTLISVALALTSVYLIEPRASRALGRIKRSNVVRLAGWYTKARLALTMATFSQHSLERQVASYEGYPET